MLHNYRRNHILPIILLFVILPSTSLHVQAKDKIITSKELQETNLQDIWQAVILLEPSLQDYSANLQGSQPYYQPNEVTLQGQNCWLMHSGENYLPLLLLDGNEISISHFKDLDVHNIERIIIHKGSSLTQYGIKGSKGAIEVITRRLKESDLTVSYQTDLTAESAKTYLQNEVSATEKKTDWLKAPIQTGVTNRHRIYIYGGDPFVKYQFNADFTPVGNGVMKGSKQQKMALGATINYQVKGVNINNQLNFFKDNAQASPWGTYDYFRQLSPALSTHDAVGYPLSLLTDVNGNQYVNPYYEATLSSSDKTEHYNFYDNLSLKVLFNQQWSLEGNLAFTRQSFREDIFRSPSSGIYQLSDNDSKGRYDILRDNQLSIETHASMHYRKQMKRNHIHGWGSFDLLNKNAENISYGGLNVPNDRMSYISFTQSYDTLHMAQAEKQYDHTIGISAGFEYNYRQRYYLEASTRYNISSVLADNNRNALFYAFGARWDIAHEAFMKGGIFKHLVIGAQIATTGGYNFTQSDYQINYQADNSNRYIYNYYLIGSTIPSIPNPDLTWYTVLNREVSLYGQIKQFSLSLNYYNNLTSDLLIFKQIPLAAGYDYTIDNGGKVNNRGLEWSFNGPLFSAQRGWKCGFQFSGTYHQNEIKSIPSYFANLYNQQLKNQYVKSSQTSSMISELHAGNPIGGCYRYSSTPTEGDETNAIYVGPSYNTLQTNIGFRINYQQWSLYSIFRTATGGYACDYDCTDLTSEKKYVKNNSVSLKTLSVGYQFKPEICKKIYAKNLSLILAANNLYDYYSSDITQGIYYPMTREITISAKITF